MLMTKTPLVSVIIPTYKDWEALNLCLEALKEQTFPREDFEIIIVNNDEPETAPPNFEIPTNGRLIHEPLPGSYSARNKAIEVAQGEILAFTDSDCIPDKRWIENALRYFRNSDAERIGGKVEVFFRNPQKKTLAELHESMFAFNQQRNVEKFKGSITANLFVYKKYFFEVGLFDGGKKSGEDFGWNRRASALGIGLIYGEDVVVKHPARASLKELAKKKRRVFGGKNFTINSAKDVYQILRYLPRMFVRNLLPSIYRVFSSNRGFSLFEQLKIVYVSLYLYVVTVDEYFKLLFGKKPER